VYPFETIAFVLQSHQPRMALPVTRSTLRCSQIDHLMISRQSLHWSIHSLVINDLNFTKHLKRCRSQTTLMKKETISSGRRTRRAVQPEVIIIKVYSSDPKEGFDSVYLFWRWMSKDPRKSKGKKRRRKCKEMKIAITYENFTLEDLNTFVQIRCVVATQFESWNFENHWEKILANTM
jgi:hypothetical protein